MEQQPYLASVCLARSFFSTLPLFFSLSLSRSLPLSLPLAHALSLSLSLYLSLSLTPEPSTQPPRFAMEQQPYLAAWPSLNVAEQSVAQVRELEPEALR